MAHLHTAGAVALGARNVAVSRRAHEPLPALGALLLAVVAEG